MQEPGKVPTLILYHDFPEQWDHFPQEVKRELGEFLERLQRGPCSPDLLEVVTQREESYYAYRLAAGGVLYWKLECDAVSISTDVDRICILAVEFDN
jgi:hypothetical protein